MYKLWYDEDKKTYRSEEEAMQRNFTVGMAGHIDHGKTSLTKALTHIDTDTLKEEKEREITIELGFAPLLQTEDLHISIVDVPGHEKFIKRMIAGVAGIDLVCLVVAADEGVMPQTKEHLEILDFLGIKGGIVVITKIDKVDETFTELVKEEIRLELESTIFSNAPIFLDNNLTGDGIEKLKTKIIEEMKKIRPRDSNGALRLPIDSIFSVKGQGTVVRGTIYEGKVKEGETLWILPKGIETRARQIQVHHQKREIAFAGERTAINLPNLSKENLTRGDVVVSSHDFVITDVIDVSLKMVDKLEYLVKQRMPILCYIGTAEVLGRIVFFDRKEIESETNEVLCQLRLEKEVVTKRGDAFILRRPSPQETIGGGWVIDPNGQKYRFGLQTIEVLQQKKEGNHVDRVFRLLLQHRSLSLSALVKLSSLQKKEVLRIIQETKDLIAYTEETFCHRMILEEMKEAIYDDLLASEQKYSMRRGLDKAVLIQKMSDIFPKKLIEYVLHIGEEDIWVREGAYIHTKNFRPSIPKSWETRVKRALEALRKDELHVKWLHHYFEAQGIPETEMKAFIHFLRIEKKLIQLNAQYDLDYDVFMQAVEKLRNETNSQFSVGDAKSILGLSRKYVIPFLEGLDQIGYTKRVGNMREWK